MTRLKSFLRHIAVPSLLSLTLFCFSSCSASHDEYTSFSGEVWNTLYHVSLRLPADLERPEVRDSILAVFRRLDASVSVFYPGSLVCRINEGTDSVVDKDFETLYRISERVNSLSGGMFDPTAEPLIRAWGFGQGHRPDADTLRIDSLLHRVGLTRTMLKDSLLIKERPDIAFNFSAVAKGYGCDEVGAMLRRLGIEDYLVEIGGEVSALGLSARGKPWTIAVESPEILLEENRRLDGEESKNEPNSAGDPLYSDIISISSGGVATSSNLRNSMMVNGRRMGHVVSPLTGFPVESDILSATVAAGSCAEADALATACILLGSQKAPDLIRRSRTSALIATSDSIIRISWPPRP